MTTPRLVVSAPFGNYVQPEGAVATLGTFTALRRPGRLWRILKTVRYYPRLRAWVNKIGLRNPGIEWLERKVDAGKITCADKLVSVHGFSPDEWWRLLDGIQRVRPLAVELNMSCKLNWIKTEYFRVGNESNHAADTTLRHQFSSLLIKSRTHVVIDEVLQKRSPGWSKT